MALTSTIKKIRECRQAYIYGAMTGYYIPVSKTLFIKTLKDMQEDLVDDWGNSRLRFHNDGDVQLDI